MTNTVKHFFGKEFSKDAFRNIFIILVPSIFLYYTVSLNFAIAFAVGVILSSLTDLPGNRQDKTMTALCCTPLFAVTALVTAMSIHYLSWNILLILAFWGFFCTLLIALGPRWGVIGNLTLIVISFTIGLKPHDPLLFFLAFTAGTASFFTISLIQVYLFPYRSLKYAMKEGFEQMATLLQTKIKCYDEQIPLEQVYRDLSVLHIKISDQLESVRSLLLREKVLINSCAEEELIWLNKIYRLIDLYELLMGIDTDYETIRAHLKTSEALPIIRRLLHLVSEEISGLENTKRSSAANDMEAQLKAELQKLIVQQSLLDATSKALITPIVAHINHIVAIIRQIQDVDIVQDATWVNSAAYKHFVPQANISQVIRKHIKTKSPIFIYSVRMATLLMLSGLVGYTLPEYRYASWIILTVILVARPSYANTQKRNYQRIVGSLVGIIISTLLALLIQDTTLLLIIAAISLYGFFLFNKPDYLICVIFITIAAILALHLYEGDIWDLLGSRLAFTLLGSIFAILGCLALPVNHRKTMSSLSDTLIDNYKSYYQKLRYLLSDDTVEHQELRLIRKHAQTSLAQLYDNLAQFQKEPRYKNQDWNHFNAFQTLAYRINALLVGVSVSITKSIEQENDSALLNRLHTIEELIHELHLLGNSGKLK